MSGYVLTIRDLFNREAQDRAFADIKADLERVTGVRLKSAQPFIGTLVIEVDNLDALQNLESKHGSSFHFRPEGQMAIKASMS